MTFRAYIDNIQSRTGLGPDDFNRFAMDKGFFWPAGITTGVKATQITDWLRARL